MENVIADQESRSGNDNTEWQLNRYAFNLCVARWGTPDIDLFASRLNHQLPTYAAWRPDPNAVAIDAFTLDWSKQFNYCFPPFCVISRVLAKIQEDRARAILVVPLWDTQPWLSRLKKIARDSIIFDRSQDLLILPHDHGARHPILRKSRMAAFLC